MRIFNRLAVLLASLYLPASAAGLGLATTSCGCAECCRCEYSCSGPGFSSTGGGETRSEDGCLDCDEACGDIANTGGCDASDVTSVEEC